MPRIEYLTRDGATYCPTCAITLAAERGLNPADPDHFGAAFSTDEMPVGGVTCDTCGDEIVPPVTIEVRRDDCSAHPRQYGDCVSVLFVPPSRYFSGDKGATDAPEDAVWSSPVYGYVHGVQLVSLTPFPGMWDSGRIGTLWVPASSGLTPEEAKRTAEAEFDQFAQYIAGDVFVVTAVRGDDTLEWCGSVYAESPEEAALTFLADFDRRKLWADCEIIFEGDD